MHVRDIHAWAILGLLTLGVAGCASSESGGWVQPTPVSNAEPTMRLDGTVRHLDVEGGVWVIRDAKGTNYEPTNLPETFRTEGMSVEAEGHRRDDLASIHMVGPLIDLVRIRKRTSAAVGVLPGLRDTSWVLEDIAGAGVVDRARATLVFAQDDSVSGNASCNQFRGSVTVTGAALSFGRLITTRKACADAVMRQEQQYLEALEQANRFEIKGSLLYIHAAGRAQSLRFVRDRS